MGSWGTGLYTGDFAADLRSTIRAVVRLPFDSDQLADIVVTAERAVAGNPSDEDYTTFWLVLADGFARYGVLSDRVRDVALGIIDAGQDVDAQRRLGQTASGLAKRRRMLMELRARISNPPRRSPRKILREPQRFVMAVGDALAYPTCGGACRNPYVTRPEQLKIYGPGGGRSWTQDGWGAAVIVERGLTFGFFAWYRPLVSLVGYETLPTDILLRDAEWLLQSPGTCSPLHFRKIGFQEVGHFGVDAAKLHARYGDLRSGDSVAIGDVSIANRLQVRVAGHKRALISRAGKHPSVRIVEIVTEA